MRGFGQNILYPIALRMETCKLNGTVDTCSTLSKCSSSLFTLVPSLRGTHVCLNPTLHFTSLALSLHNNNKCCSCTSLTPHATQHIAPHNPPYLPQTTQRSSLLAFLHITQFIKKLSTSLICNNGSAPQVCLCRPIHLIQIACSLKS